MLLERGANPNMQLFFRPANLNGVDQYAGLHAADPRGGRRGYGNDQAAVGTQSGRQLSDGRPADHHHCGDSGPGVGDTGSRDHPHDAGSRRGHQCRSPRSIIREDSRGGTALHYAARKRWKEVIKKLASYGINMNAKDQDGLTALDYTQCRGYMAFMALQTPVYKDEAALLRELGATEMLARRIPIGRSWAHLKVSKRTSGRWVIHEHMRRSTRTIRIKGN